MMKHSLYDVIVKKPGTMEHHHTHPWGTASPFLWEEVRHGGDILPIQTLLTSLCLIASIYACSDTYLLQVLTPVPNYFSLGDAFLIFY